jgi:mannose-6-phosphate isomerase-like protein (cupin superfamily)
MKQPFLFNAAEIEWQPHPKLAGIRVKSLINSSTFSQASLTLVEVAPAGVIELHSHENGYEMAFVLSGGGVLSLPDGDVELMAGRGVNVPPATAHALKNTGDAPMQILAVHLPPIM